MLRRLVTGARTQNFRALNQVRCFAKKKTGEEVTPTPTPTPTAPHVQTQASAQAPTPVHEQKIFKVPSPTEEDVKIYQKASQIPIPFRSSEHAISLPAGQLYQLSVALGKDYKQELGRFLQLQQNNEVPDVFDDSFPNRSIRGNRLPQILDFLNQHKFDKHAIHMIARIAEERTLSLLPQILEFYDQILLTARNEVPGVITLAKPIPAKYSFLLDRIKLEAALNLGPVAKQVNFTVRYDPGIIGGYIAEVEGVQLNSSVAREINEAISSYEDIVRDLDPVNVF